MWPESLSPSGVSACLEVRIVSTLYDYFLIVVSLAAFVTGFLAVHQAPGYDLWLIAHVLSGELLLVLIPATKLWHVVGFFLSRGNLAQTSASSGAIRARVLLGRNIVLE